VAQSYFDDYNANQGTWQSATISVVETRHLPGLAWQLNQLFRRYSVDMQLFDRTSVQRLDLYKEQYTFDLLDYVDKLFPDVDKSDFIAQLNKVVRYKNHTPQFLMEYDILTYCGLSCYIPHSEREDLNEYYKTLRWYREAFLR